MKNNTEIDEKDYKTDLKIINRNTSNILRIVAAIMIMLGHIIPKENNVCCFFFAGELWVGVFFFYSGYGSGLKFKNNVDIVSYLYEKLIHIWLPFSIANTTYYILHIILGYESFDNLSLLEAVIGIALFNPTLWYIIEVLFMYIIWCLVHVLCESGGGRQAWIWTVCYAVFLVIGVVSDIGTWWYISTSAFLLGVWLVYKKGVVVGLVNNRAIRVIVTVIFLAVYLIYKYISYMGQLIFAIPHFAMNYAIVAFQMVLVPLFVIVIEVLLALIEKKTTLERRGDLQPESAMTIWLKKLSFSIYLWHMWFYSLFRSMLTGIFVVCVLTIVCTLVWATIISGVLFERVIHKRQT